MVEQKKGESKEMQIELYESELREVAPPADVDELLKGIATERRLQENASKTKRRLVELDAIIASPKAAHRLIAPGKPRLMAVIGIASIRTK